MNNFDDTPIDDPSEDRFGFTPFAKAISDCIRELDNSFGSVVAIYGPWGSGKSSAINLVRYNLFVDAKDINVINFAAWAYHSKGTLVAGFLTELSIGLSPVLSKQKRAAIALRKIAANLTGVGNLVGTIEPYATGSCFLRAITHIIAFLNRSSKSNETNKDLQDRLARALRRERKRFLVIIDDLDRLSPEEALVVFRLIKSVGRLPNVVYLIAYDRDKTEKAVAERFPSEGSHYLEKIVQAGFELPNLDQHRLNDMMLGYLNDIASGLTDFDIVEFRRLFSWVVVPELKTPRDVIRLANTLLIVVKPIKNDVFFPDVMSLETLRIFRPGVYMSIRANKSRILNASRVDRRGNRKEHLKDIFRELLASEAEDSHKRRLEGVLIRLFPQLQGDSTSISHSETQLWKRQRRVCSREHFDTYFRFTVSPRTIPKEELDYLLNSERTIDEIQQRFVEATETSQAKEPPKAPYLLDELTAHGATISVTQAELILSALFPIADKIIDLDKNWRFVLTDNKSRIYSLLRSFLCNNRTTIEKRSAILTRCMRNASLIWLLDFTRSAWEDYHPRDPDKKPSPENKSLLTMEHAEMQRGLARHQIENAATNDTLIDMASLAHVLFEWNDLKTDGSDEVNRFVANAIADDKKIIKLADAFLKKLREHRMRSISRSPGDNFFHEIGKLLNVDNFRARLTFLSTDQSLPEEERIIIRRLLMVWDAEKDRERGKD